MEPQKIMIKMMVFLISLRIKIPNL